ncbi:MAG: phage protease [Pseudomonadota bacterium]|nr:phage protease [Pseudomonadota bacterium]
MASQALSHRKLKAAAFGAVAVAACFAAVPTTPESAGAQRVLLQLMPAQDFGPNDGRTLDVPAWRMSADVAARVAAAFDAAQPPVIDYEHQTLHKETNGQPAPAAGWMHALRWIDGRGLFAEAELTARARELIAAGEYRYFSPVFEYSRATGEVQRILMGALTNHPAISGMQALDLAVAATARFNPSQPETDVTLLEKLLAALGLPADTTEDAALAACTARKAQADAALAALKLDAAAAPDAVTAACAAQATPATPAAPDPAQYVPIAVVKELQTNVAALTAAQAARAVDDQVVPALADGRLLPAQEAWARELGKSNLAALTAYLQTAQPIAALTATQTQGKAPGGDKPCTPALSADELAVAAACGLTPEQYATGRA